MAQSAEIMATSEDQGPSSTEVAELEEALTLELHAVSGRSLGQLSASPSTTGAELKAQATKLARAVLGPGHSVLRLLAGCNVVTPCASAASLQLASGDSITAVVGACERARLTYSDNRLAAWSYANDAAGKLFLGCGDDFNVLPGFADDGSAATHDGELCISFEASRKASHYVVTRDEQLRLLRLSPADLAEPDIARAATFRLRFDPATVEEKSAIKCCLEPFGRPVLCVDRSLRLGVLPGTGDHEKKWRLKFERGLQALAGFA